MNENLQEQRLISQSLNEALEDMRRLILEMTETNDAMMASSRLTIASSEGLFALHIVFFTTPPPKKKGEG